MREAKEKQKRDDSDVDVARRKKSQRKNKRKFYGDDDSSDDFVDEGRNDDDDDNGGVGPSSDSDVSLFGLIQQCQKLIFSFSMLFFAIYSQTVLSLISALMLESSATDGAARIFANHLLPWHYLNSHQ